MERATGRLGGEVRERGALEHRIRRVVGIASGIATHLLFAITVCYLFLFLSGSLAPQRGPLWIDLLLALQFAVSHSLLLHPAIRRRLEPWIGRSFYGLFFCAVTCGSLLLTFAWWRTSSVVVWEFHAWPSHFARWAFFGSWVALFYSLHLSGLTWQTGLTPWWQWVQGKPAPQRTFRETGLYRWFRHPIYLSFLGLIWFTPRLSLDHALLTAVWTFYIFLGSWLKDRRLEYYMGDTYREYEARVPGYPLMVSGPLGRRQVPSTAA